MFSVCLQTIEPEPFLEELISFLRLTAPRGVTLKVFDDFEDRLNLQLSVNSTPGKRSLRAALRETFHFTECGLANFFCLKAPGIKFEEFTYGIDVELDDRYKKLFLASFSRTLNSYVE